MCPCSDSSYCVHAAVINVSVEKAACFDVKRSKTLVGAAGFDLRSAGWWSLCFTSRPSEVLKDKHEQTDKKKKRLKEETGE